MNSELFGDIAYGNIAPQ